MSYPKLKKETKVKSFSCGKCTKRFSTKFSMQRHFKECGVEPQRVECERCNKSLKNAEILEKHQVVCFGLSKKVACSLCDELFCSPFSLRRHLWRFHENEKWPEEMVQSEPKLSQQHKNDTEKKEDDTKDKRILNFALARTAGEDRSNCRYYMDVVCYDYEYLEDEVDALQFDKPVIYPVTKVKKG